MCQIIVSFADSEEDEKIHHRLIVLITRDLIRRSEPCVRRKNEEYTLFIDRRKRRKRVKMPVKLKKRRVSRESLRHASEYFARDDDDKIVRNDINSNVHQNKRGEQTYLTHPQGRWILDKTTSRWRKAVDPWKEKGLGEMRKFKRD